MNSLESDKNHQTLIKSRASCWSFTWAALEQYHDPRQSLTLARPLYRLCAQYAACSLRSRTVPTPDERKTAEYRRSAGYSEHVFLSWPGTYSSDSSLWTIFYVICLLFSVRRTVEENGQTNRQTNGQNEARRYSLPIPGVCSICVLYLDRRYLDQLNEVKSFFRIDSMRGFTHGYPWSRSESTSLFHKFRSSTVSLVSSMNNLSCDWLC